MCKFISSAGGVILSFKLRGASIGALAATGARRLLNHHCTGALCGRSGAFLVAAQTGAALRSKLKLGTLPLSGGLALSLKLTAEGFLSTLSLSDGFECGDVRSSDLIQIKAAGAFWCSLLITAVETSHAEPRYWQLGPRTCARLVGQFARPVGAPARDRPLMSSCTSCANLAA